MLPVYEAVKTNSRNIDISDIVSKLENSTLTQTLTLVEPQCSQTSLLIAHAKDHQYKSWHRVKKTAFFTLWSWSILILIVSAHPYQATVLVAICWVISTGASFLLNGLGYCSLKTSPMPQEGRFPHTTILSFNWEHNFAISITIFFNLKASLTDHYIDCI